MSLLVFVDILRKMSVDQFVESDGQLEVVGEGDACVRLMTEATKM